MLIVFGFIFKACAVDYSKFCDGDLVEQLFQSKTKLDGLSRQDFYNARTRANPYELIGKSIFVNRSAVKMANLDALFALTDADLRTNGGGAGDGERVRDIYKGDNMRDFARQVMDSTSGDGVDLVTADGGFCVDGDELHQEHHSRQIILCEIATMFSILRKHGDFLCKIFDAFTPFTAELIYLLYCHFDKIAIVKPFTSRPANSERYIVCRNLLVDRPQPVIEHLLSVNDKLTELNVAAALRKTKDEVPSQVSSHNTPPPGFGPYDEKVALGLLDVTNIIDPSVVKADEDFMDWLEMLNVKMAVHQNQALQEIQNYANKPDLPTFDQADVRKRCLNEWSLPDVIRLLGDCNSLHRHPHNRVTTSIVAIGGDENTMIDSHRGIRLMGEIGIMALGIRAIVTVPLIVGVDPPLYSIMAGVAALEVMGLIVEQMIRHEISTKDTRASPELKQRKKRGRNTKGQHIQALTGVNVLKNACNKVDLPTLHLPAHHITKGKIVLHLLLARR
ncbi:FtsJ methyltransferase domain-containing protein 2 [Quaeritorhiza haematococci]|nr:FtsJ methyltransferase domain-containing protein 2 [Quaeritorhiza haematococci]